MSLEEKQGVKIVMKYRIIKFREIIESEGNLLFYEIYKEIPFQIKRVFSIYDVPQDCVRGEHASINTEFVLTVLKGSVLVELDDGKQSKKIILNDKTKGIYVPTNLWIKVSDFTADAILNVYASEIYEDCVYVNEYSEFIRIAEETK